MNNVIQIVDLRNWQVLEQRMIGIWQCTRVSAPLKNPPWPGYCRHQGQKLSGRDRVVSLGDKVVVTPTRYEVETPICRSFVPGLQEKSRGVFYICFLLQIRIFFYIQGLKRHMNNWGPGK